MKGFLTFLLVLVVVVIFLAGLAGFVPGLSTILGTNKPKDLGVHITKEDSAKAQEKSGVVLVELPANTPVEESYQLSGQRAASFSFDSKEATGVINNRPWKYYPFYDLQLRINSDGTIETSGMVDMSILMNYAKSLGYATDDVNSALSQYHIPKINMPFYIKGTGSVIDNKVAIDVQSFEAGRVPIPSGVLSSNMDRINSFAQDVVDRQKGFTAKKLDVEDGKIVFDGTMPEKESIVVK